MKRQHVLVAVIVALVFGFGRTASVMGSENINITINYDNQSKLTFNPFNPKLKWGKFTTYPVTLKAGSKGTAFASSGAAGSATGTQGSIDYRDGSGHSFTFKRDIPYSASNSGGISNCVGCDKDFVLNMYPIPEHGNSIVLNLTITDK